MKKLQLNKKVVSSLNDSEMSTVKGGVRIKVFGASVHSCAKGTREKKRCCYTDFTEW